MCFVSVETGIKSAWTGKYKTSFKRNTMASISNVTVTSGDTTLISEGTGTYEAESRVLVCVGKWDSEPSAGSSYSISFESVDPYGQPFSNCLCTDFEKGGETTATFTNKG